MLFENPHRLVGVSDTHRYTPFPVIIYAIEAGLSG